VYVGGGSGTGETALSNNVQSLAPMSRNLGGAVLTAHPSWTPTARNVVGLDAAVIVTKGVTNRCKNFSLPVTNFPLEQTNKANPNNTTPYTLSVPRSGYDQALEVILSGIDGSGTTAACSDPRRLQAILDFAACQNVGTIRTFYRRDDNSGTTNTFQDKIQVGRFCNGRARGVLGNNTIDPANKNLNNQDLDPIRRPCPAPSVVPGTSITRPATRCTDVSTGLFCTAAANPAGCEATGTCPCTQGLVVALSIGDAPANGLPDVTETIASRVAADSAGTVFGFAGREAIAAGRGTNAPYVNTNTYSDSVVRLDGYLLSRRLYVQYAPDNTSLGTGGGGAPRVAAETALYNFMTDPDGTTNPDGSQGRCNIESIVKTAGFITCTASCTSNPTGNNLCARTPFPAAPSTLSNCLPNGTGSEPGSPGASSTSWDFGSFASASAGVCCSNNVSIAAGATCPSAKTGRPQYAACSFASTTSTECASGICEDVQGVGELQCN
jgi:hypothetical protein